MNKTIIKNLVAQAIDLHVHIGPEVIPRRFNSIDQLIKAERGKIGGMALKNHFYPTQPMITATQVKTDLILVGGVVLNNFQGGLNPEAIYANSVIATRPTIVWLPTVNAEQFLKTSQYEIAPEWVQRQDFTARLATDIRPVMIDNSIQSVLTMIKDRQAILATGHISWQAAVKVINQAACLGLKRLIITHPIYQRINFPLTAQIKMAQLGVKLEQCYSMYSIDQIPIAKIVAQIKAVGAKNCIISSDVGQTFSPPPSQALSIFAELLAKAGITTQELAVMLIDNPRQLVEI